MYTGPQDEYIYNDTLSISNDMKQMLSHIIVASATQRAGAEMNLSCHVTRNRNPAIVEAAGGIWVKNTGIHVWRCNYTTLMSCKLSYGSSLEETDLGVS